ncbi:hypothetical protein [Phaeobacter inhibens]|uniref:hypothetical protein n=1 Tax=Phaeobacter inhibens TaxID=221822 RepID=UPI000C9C6DE6|nr:hypothetical protein [Phaeobacter inhibens]AUQ70949.1 hypothetical protein PhaeoP54_02069 [Phaeobacter inhibens]UWR47764.1 hypothetical protein K4F87_10450 [Phaeobacter inhibens]UWR51680.1 hypothetical protein K4F84_10670 [Phaeobacter inhibens]UWR67244.1 hypothetical protein K4K95_10780 [Phaeobacter inhibens]UWR71176.1 hypothetical protein K4L00_10765 [Phaeobacter inhibens]
MQAKLILAAFGLCTTLVACGDTTGEQVVYGAGAGAVGSALLNGNLVAGAAVGAAANVIYCKENPRKC